MSNLQIFNNEEFGSIRTVEINNEPYFVGKDVAEALGYSAARNAIAAHVDDDDKLTHQISAAGQMRDVTVINESGVYALVFGSKLESAKKFKHWVTSEVLPAIRKTGGYHVPQTFAEALRAYADQVEQNQKLQNANAMQAQQIAEFKPVKDYVDQILSSTDTVLTSQISADYGLSARALNKILHDRGVQYKAGDQWLLYQKHRSKGYTKSDTINITRSNGNPDVIMQTKWTQKGRLFIHNLLTSMGYQANVDKDKGALSCSKEK